MSCFFDVFSFVTFYLNVFSNFTLCVFLESVGNAKQSFGFFFMVCHKLYLYCHQNMRFFLLFANTLRTRPTINVFVVVKKLDTKRLFI